MALSDRFLQRSNQSPSSYKEYLMTTDDPTPEGYSGFLERSSGNLNTAEVGALTAAGASRDEILPGNLNRTEMEMLNNSAPMNRFNQGGIVSLRHLTRPLGI